MASTRPKAYVFTFVDQTLPLVVDNVMTQSISVEADTILSLRQAVIQGETVGREVNVNLSHVKYYTVQGPKRG